MEVESGQRKEKAIETLLALKSLCFTVSLGQPAKGRTPTRKIKRRRALASLTIAHLVISSEGEAAIEKSRV